MVINWNKILMYICFIYSGVAFEFVYIQLLPLFNNSAHYALPPPPFVYDPIYKTTPSYIWYIVIVTFLGSVVSLLAGISLYRIEGKNEADIITQNWVQNVTDEGDRKILGLLKENIMTQSALVKESGLTKVKVHRILVKLENYGMIEKSRYGQTNRIRLKREGI